MIMNIDESISENDQSLYDMNLFMTVSSFFELFSTTRCISFLKEWIRWLSLSKVKQLTDLPAKSITVAMNNGFFAEFFHATDE